MIDKLVSPQYISLLEKSLAADALRHKTISNNIANVNTPGFKRSEVVFEDLLYAAENYPSNLQMKTTDEKHIGNRPDSSVQPFVRTETNTALRTDGNNVDIDREMADMAKNQIHYNVLAQKISGFYTGLKNVIREGK